MKKFKFRLEKVLQHRSSLKEEAKRALTLRTQEHQNLVSQEQSLEVEYRRQALQEGVVVEAKMLSISAGYCLRLKELIEKTRKDIIEAKKRLDEAMEQYVAASKEERTLTTLKDKKLAEYLEKVAKEEQEFLDELTTQRAKKQTPFSPRNEGEDQVGDEQVS